MKLAVFSAVGASLIAVCVTWSVARALLPPDVPEADRVTSADQRKLADRVAALAEDLRNVDARLSDIDLRLSTFELGRDEELAAPDPQDGPRSVEISGAPADGDASGTGAASDDAEIEAALTVADAVALLSDPENSWSSKQQIWSRLVKEGGMDEVIATLEDRAREAPNDVGRQFELSAYVQKLLTVGDLEKGRWFMQADSSFDRALAIDPQHWASRFSKAMSYSFAPSALGYQPRAVENFEILVEQQENRLPQPHYAQTYLMLGNLYSSQGKPDRAGEIWSRGLQLYPDDASLAKQVQVDQKVGRSP